MPNDGTPGTEEEHSKGDVMGFADLWTMGCAEMNEGFGPTSLIGNKHVGCAFDDEGNFPRRR